MPADDSIARVQPVAVVLNDQPPVCWEKPCLCEHIQGGINFWEMMGKNAQCLRAVEKREGAEAPNAVPTAC